MNSELDPETAKSEYRDEAVEPPLPGAENVKVGDVLDDRYELVEVVGRGGCGVVFRATDLNLQRDVAVKVLSGEGMGQPDTLERFEREGQILRRLHAANTVFFYDCGQTPQHLPYIVMEFVTGRQLKTRIAEEGSIAPEETVAILIQVFQALTEAHELGFVHRDLKPSNIMLCERIGFPGAFVKVLDFGIAKIVTEDDGDAKGDMAGTPKYMAPEQFKNEPVTARADLYSMGCIAYEMLTGIAPFDGETLHVTVAKHLFMKPKGLEAKFDVYPNLEAVVFKLLEKKPEDRFASAQDVLNALDHWQEPALIDSLAGVDMHGSEESEDPFASGSDSSSSEPLPQAYAEALGKVSLKGIYAIKDDSAPSSSPLDIAAAEHREMLKSCYEQRCIERKKQSLSTSLVVLFLIIVFLCVAGVIFYYFRSSGAFLTGEDQVTASPERTEDREGGNPAELSQNEFIIDSAVTDATNSALYAMVMGVLPRDVVREMCGTEPQAEEKPPEPKAEPAPPRRHRSRSVRRPAPPKFNFMLVYKPSNAQVKFEHALGQCSAGKCNVRTTSDKIIAKVTVSAPGFVSKSVRMNEKVSMLNIDLKKEK